MEKLISTSVQHTMELAERALSLTVGLGPAIATYWRELYARAGPEESQSQDFGAVCAKIYELMRSLQRQLVVAAIVEELQPGPASRAIVRAFQQRLNVHFDRLRNLLMLSGFTDEADSLRPKRTYFRGIRGLPLGGGGARDLAIPKLLQAMMAIEPRALIEAHLGFMAISGFPDRPTSPQQQRRKRRRRRRANPGAPTASYRPWRDDEDDD